MQAEIIEQRVRSSQQSGRHCAFFVDEIGNGIKAYFSESMRNRCYLWQRRLYKLGFAPKAYNRFSVGKYFCYMTAVARVSNELVFDYELRDKLVRDIYKKTGKIYKDDCWFNFGYIDGNIVIIDCDPFEFNGFKQDRYDKWRKALAKEEYDMEGYLELYGEYSSCS